MLPSHFCCLMFTIWGVWWSQQSFSLSPRFCLQSLGTRTVLVRHNSRVRTRILKKSSIYNQFKYLPQGSKIQAFITGTRQICASHSTWRSFGRHFRPCSNQRRPVGNIPEELLCFGSRLHEHFQIAIWFVADTKKKSDTCDEQSCVPAGLGASSLQPHEADLQLLLIGLRSRENSAVARLLHHGATVRVPAARRREDKATPTAQVDASVPAAVRVRARARGRSRLADQLYPHWPHSQKNHFI